MVEGERRKSGIAVIGDVPWGTHFCQFYKTKEDLLDLLVPYFKEGLEQNEYCMWVTSEPLTEVEAASALRKVVPDVDRYLATGQLEIIPYTDWYRKGGTFEADRVLKGWVERLDQARAKGFEGLRLTGNTFWLESKEWRAFTDYEQTVNNVIGQFHMVALCTYSLEKCGASEVADVVSTHQFALIKREGQWTLIETSERKRAEEELRTYREHLEELVAKRTAELTLRQIEQQVLLDLIPAQVWFKDTQNRFLRVNRAAAEAVQRPPSEIEGRSACEFFPDEAAGYYRDDLEVIATGRPKLGIVEQFTTASGSKRWVRTDKVPYRDPQGAIIGILVFTQDITAQMKMEEQLGRLAAIVASSSDAIIGKTLDGTVTSWNHGAERLYGYRAEEMLGRSIAILFPPDRVAEEPAILQQIARSETVQAYDTVRLRKDGSSIDVSVMVSPIRDAAGHVIGASTIAHDVTERKRVDTMLRRSEEQYRLLAASIAQTAGPPTPKGGAAATVTSKERALGTYVSPFARTFFPPTSGRSPWWGYGCAMLSVVVAAAARQLVDPILGDRYPYIVFFGAIAFTAWYGGWRPALLACLLGYPVASYYFIPPRGSLAIEDVPSYIGLGLYALVGAGTVGLSALQQAAQGALEREVRRRAEAERGLRQASHYNRSLIEVSLDPLVTIGPDGTITDVNAATEAATGCLRSELIGTEFATYCTEPEKARSGYQQVFREGFVRDYPLEIRHRDGHRTPVLYNASLYRDETGRVIGVFAAARDITEGKRAETAIRQLNAELEQRVAARTQQLEVANQELEAFAYSVSHDLRAPLRSIDGFSLAVLEDYAEKVDEQGREYLRRLRAASQRMAELIDSLLALSRVTRSEMHVESVDLSGLAGEIAEDLQRTNPERQVTVVIAKDLIVRGDKTLLRGVLDNLLGNAWKFTAPHATARIEFGTVPHEGRRAYFVRDDGVGFDMAYVGKLFAPFQRLHSTAEFPGHGIGLATVQRIIRRHGGHVWAEGAVEGGATFYFTLGG